MTKFKETKIGVALRWIAVIPVFLIVGLIVNVFLTFVYNFSMPEDSGFRKLFEPITKPLFITYTALLYASLFAPKPKAAFYVLVLAITVGLSVSVTAINMGSGKYYISPMNTVCLATGILGAFVGVYFSINKNEDTTI